MLQALYYFVLNGLHHGCVLRWEDACKRCKAYHLVELALLPHVECVSRRCKYCGEAVTFKELRLGDVLRNPVLDEADTHKFELFHFRCKLEEYDKNE